LAAWQQRLGGGLAAAWRLGGSGLVAWQRLGWRLGRRLGMLGMKCGFAWEWLTCIVSPYAWRNNVEFLVVEIKTNLHIYVLLKIP
jgi:hypothetical protein